MSNAWLNHVRQLRKNNRNMSYKQLLKHAKNSYSGGADGDAPAPAAAQVVPPTTNQPTAMSGLQNAMKMLTRGGSGVTGFESRSSLTRSATTLGGRRRRSTRKTRRRRR